MRLAQAIPAWRRRPGFLRRRFCVGAMSVLAGVVTGCADFGAMPAGGVTREAAVAKYFILQGRISVRVGDRIDTGSITWRRQPDEERLSVFTPFGNQVAEILRQGSGRVELRRDQETTFADSINALTADVLGIALDMDAIAAWTQGAGLADGTTMGMRFANGDVWQVTAERLQSRNQYQFVSRLSAVRGDTAVKLVVDDWQAR
jgi:outer membrane lipoprotein LolB